MAIDKKDLVEGPNSARALAEIDGTTSLLENGEVSGSSDLIRTAFGFQGNGPIGSGATSTFWGINHRNAGNFIPQNIDEYGLVYFTRPRLNLSYDNIISQRTLTMMNNPDPKSIARAIRAYLDPDGADLSGRESHLVDPRNPFIPMLSNQLISMSGWPDHYVDTYTSKAGSQQQQFSMMDGFPKIYGTYDITCNFQNMVGDALGLFFHIWTQCGILSHAGDIIPRVDELLENELNYMTRIGRLILDPTKTYVQQIIAAPVAFPITNPTGAKGNFAKDKPFNQDINQYSITFRCIGAEYYDPILMKEFNDLVMIFNPAMVDGVRESLYTKLNDRDKVLFNYRGYPRINPKTTELEWWVPNEEYASVVNGVKQLVPTYF